MIGNRSAGAGRRVAVSREEHHMWDLPIRRRKSSKGLWVMPVRPPRISTEGFSLLRRQADGTYSAAKPTRRR